MAGASRRGEVVGISRSVVDRARRGDHDAFATLIHPFDRGLRALAYRLLGDRERMDDAVQETYLRAYRGLPRFRGQAGLGTWLYRIAYNVCLEELRRTRRLPLVPLDGVDESLEEGADLADGVSLCGDLATALAALSPEDRAAVILVDAHGFDYRTAAAVLGIPGGTVASRLNRARASLRRALAERMEGVSNG